MYKSSNKSLDQLSSKCNVISNNIQLSKNVELAVQARNIVFYYDSVHLTSHGLQGVSMNVPVGSIYGLLGPSGCGKTTLLSIISGLKKPAHGTIQVFGFSPGSPESGVPGSGLGYMPQDTALQSDLTVYEVLWFFGKLYFLPQNVLHSRINHLIQILELPDKNHLIANLSGGQQRRVSLACSVIHKPRLVILDEPTCGLDPVLSATIWNFLNQLARENGMTIIVTTHYIEECRKAGIIGFMREGKLLDEGEPETFMQRYHVKSIETIFYKMCYTEKIGAKKLVRNNLPSQVVDGIQSDYRVPHKASMHLTWTQIYFTSIYVLIWRYFIQIVRSPGFIALTLVLPILSLTLVYLSIGHAPRKIPIGWIVDEQPSYDRVHADISEYSQSWISLKIPYYPQVLNDSVDHQVLNLIPYETLDRALIDVKSTKIKAAIYMKPGFSSSFHDRFDIFTTKFVDNETISRGKLWLYGDMTDKFILSVIEAILELAIAKTARITAPSFNMTEYQKRLPIVFDQQLESLDFGQAFIDRSETSTIGFALTLIFACAFTIAFLAHNAELSDKVFVRINATGLSPAQIIIAHLGSRFLFLGLNAINSLVTCIYLLEIPCRNSIFLAFLVIWLEALAGCACGTILAQLFPDFSNSLFVSLGAASFVLFISGTFWPIESLPYYMKPLRYVSPISEPVIALRSIMLSDNFNFTAFAAPAIVTTTFWIIGSAFISIFLLKITTN